MPKTEKKYITENFTVKEIECRCGCGAKNIDQLLMYKLQLTRDLYGNAMTITSGVRCKEWNKKQGGSENSAHLTGEAIDTLATNSRKRFLLIKAFMVNGFTRIGVSYNFIHVDIDKTKADNVLFLYSKQPDKH